MADEGLKGMIFALMFFVIFGALIIGFAVQLGDNYGRSSLEIGNGSLSKVNFENSANTLNSNTDDYRSRYDKSGGEVTGGDTGDEGSIFSIIFDITTIIITPFTLLSQTLTNVIGIPSYVINGLLGMLALSIIFLSWRAWKSGS